MTKSKIGFACASAVRSRCKPRREERKESLFHLHAPHSYNKNNNDNILKISSSKFKQISKSLELCNDYSKIDLKVPCTCFVSTSVEVTTN